MRAGMLAVLAVLLLAASSFHLAAAARDATRAEAAKLMHAGGNGAVYSPWACGVIAEGYQIVPGSDWGSTTGEIQQKWTEGNCDLKICAHYVAKYGVVPGKSMGALPSRLVPAWTWDRPNGKGNCEKLWATGAAGITAQEDGTDNGSVYGPWGCGVISQGYELIPGRNWGSTPGAVQQKWTDSSCDIKICAFLVSKYSIVPGAALPADMPTEFQKSWEWDRPNGGSCDKIWTASL